MTATYDLFINNERVCAPDQERFPAINPYTREAWASVPQASPAQVADAIAAARRAFDTVWSGTTGYERARLMLRLADLLEADADRMAVMETTDNGKAIRETRGQMSFAARVYRFFAGMADKLTGATIPVDRKDAFDFTRREPMGVCVLITAWNSPISLLASKLAPALAAGNCVVVKPSEHASVTTLAFADKVREAGFPPGVVNIVTGDHRTGQALLRSGRVDRVSFTGSPGVGARIAADAGERLIPVTLELGGKSPAVICDDYPLAKAAERILFVKLFNAGQICTTVDHVFVPEHRVGDFVELARRIVPARYPRLDSPDLTAVIDARAFGRITAALAEAETRGASVIPLLPGPRWDESTRRIAPHLVLDLPADCELATREIFGPVLPVYAYTALEDVIQRINAQPRPLAFYPFSNDRTRVQLLIERVISGGVSVNDALFHVAQHDLPFGGVGASGMGHYHGHEGFLTFSKLRPVFRQARFSPLKFLAPPYGRLATTILEFLSR